MYKFQLCDRRSQVICRGEELVFDKPLLRSIKNKSHKMHTYYFPTT